MNFGRPVVQVVPELSGRLLWIVVNNYSILKIICKFFLILENSIFVIFLTHTTVWRLHPPQHRSINIYTI